MLGVDNLNQLTSIFLTENRHQELWERLAAPTYPRHQASLLSKPLFKENVYVRQNDPRFSGLHDSLQGLVKIYIILEQKLLMFEIRSYIPLDVEPMQLDIRTEK